MEKYPSVSVIVPCRNEEKFITKCLNSIIQQDYPHEKMEILVIDGMSEDKTRQIAKKISQRNPIVELLDNPKKITPAAFNLGIKNAKGDVIIIMGAHAKYKKDYISKCIETLLKYNADNVGGILRAKASKNTLIAKGIAYCLSSFFGVGNSYFRKGAKKVLKVDTVFGGCYRKEVFKKIGFFDERIVRNQDLELNLRLKKTGGKILLAPDIISYYYPKANLIDFAKHNFRDAFWVTYPLKFRLKTFRWRHLMPLFFVSGLIGSGALGIFFPLFLKLFLFIIILYLLITIFSSIVIAIEKKNFRYLFLMPLAFASRHIPYGIGSIWGLIKAKIL